MHALRTRGGPISSLRKIPHRQWQAVSAPVRAVAAAAMLSAMAAAPAAAQSFPFERTFTWQTSRCST